MAKHRHKRETNARRIINGLVASRPTSKIRLTALAAPLAVVATASAVGVGVFAAEPVTDRLSGDLAAAATADVGADLGAAFERDEVAVSRGTATRGAVEPATEAPVAEPEKPSRLEAVMAPAAVREAVRQADTRLFTTTVLNLWTQPGEQAEQVGELAAGERVLVTGRQLFDREEIVLDGEARWVTTGYLSAEEPLALGGECTNGTSVPDGVAENVKLVHAAVCAAFPEIEVYGTFRSDGEHSQGIAVDIMVSGDRGYEVAEFLRENYADLGINYLIYAQEIWSVDRSGEGWRGMEDRGSSTANHYDHVHVTTY